jgi:hypothetical protein
MGLSSNFWIFYSFSITSKWTNFFFPFGSLTPCRTNLSMWRFLYSHTCPLTSHGYAQINKWLVPFNHNNINSNFWFGILFFFFYYFLPYMTISSYMSFFLTTKTPHSILLKFIILIITMLVILIIFILLTTNSQILIIWSWIILSISKLIIWCVILMWLFLLLHN